MDNYPYKEADQVIIWQPNSAPQNALISCPIFEVFFGGARGGGKTEGSLGDWLQHSAAYGEAAIGIFVRKTLNQLTEVIARAQQIFLRVGATYHKQEKTFTMKNGARLKFVYLERDSDAENYQGHSYTRVYIEEATNFSTPIAINKLRATLRSASGVPVGLRLTGNPGGPGHNWVKARYIDPDPKGYKVITESTDLEQPDGSKIVVSLSRVFIPSKMRDNVDLLRNDPTYKLRLMQSGSEALVRAWLEGDWSIVDGAFFSEWDQDKHVLDTQQWAPKIPKDSLKFRSFDWGSAKPFSVGWYALSDGTWGLPKFSLLKYREWYGASGPNVGLKMLATDVAKGVSFREKGERIRYGVADPSIYKRDGGPSIAESMAIAGCMWRRADNSRKAGAEAVHQRLIGEMTLVDNKIITTPMLYFLDCCEDTTRTIPILQHDETDTEDVDTDGEDHAYDETRYAMMSRPWIPRTEARQQSGMPKLPGQYTIDELVEKNRKQRLLAEEV